MVSTDRRSGPSALKHRCTQPFWKQSFSGLKLWLLLAALAETLAPWRLCFNGSRPFQHPRPSPFTEQWQLENGQLKRRLFSLLFSLFYGIFLYPQRSPQGSSLARCCLWPYPTQPSSHLYPLTGSQCMGILVPGNIWRHPETLWMSQLQGSARGTQWVEARQERPGQSPTTNSHTA